MSFVTSHCYQSISITQLVVKMSGRQNNAKKISACRHTEIIFPNFDFNIDFCPGFSLFSFKRQSAWWVYLLQPIQMQMRNSQKSYYRNPIPRFADVYKILIFCWPCITAYQYSETNVMHFLFNLLRIKGLYMFRALFAHTQEALHKRHLVHCVRVMSVDCTSSTPILVQPTDVTCTQYTMCR
jgi:hypothetical protein